MTMITWRDTFFFIIGVVVGAFLWHIRVIFGRGYRPAGNQAAAQAQVAAQHHQGPGQNVNLRARNIWDVDEV